ncbi:hypothetical protein C1645_838694 [Glomus cerebriforme]|uniref:Uncharacterized protein n=1 Tax=Glomus cerebriforme TaxID=658196 RepID=A0A397S6X8_9GLOM|nr:hypothetical protein C1645_838694 [Glomus cerebriforme]
MTKRSYKDGKLKAENHSFHIYCTVCDSLVIICKNTIECANDHLNKCIAKTAEMYLAYFNTIQKNVKKKEKEYHYLVLLNLEKGLHIPYLTVQKLSNKLGELTRINLRYGQNKFEIW